VLPATLFARIRARADVDGLSISRDAELGPLCEEKYFELWDILIASLGDEAPWERAELTTTANQNYVDIALSTPVYKPLRLEFKGNGTVWLPVHRFNLAAEGRSDQSKSWTSARSFRYYARRSARATATARKTIASAYATWKIYFDSPPDSAHPLGLFYVPPPPITINTDGVSYDLFPDDYPEYVVQSVLFEIAKKVEADPGPFAIERDRIRGIIEGFAAPHQLNQPKTIADLRSTDGGMGGYDSSHGFMDRY
jgi:hypothetical protein